MMKYYQLHLFIIAPFLILTSILSCSRDSEVTLESDETSIMATRLDNLNRNSDPQFNHFANQKRVEYLTTLSTPDTPAERFTYKGTLGQEMIYAGQTDEAITLLESLLKELENSSAEYRDQFTENTLDLLALAWLRLGEQQNCIINHSAESCLFPIQGEGIHTLVEGSEKAIELYEKLLSDWRPGDMETIWLLNIAYMTLGNHPGAVPEEWLISAEHFEDSESFPRFRDVAPTVGLADYMALSGGSITEDFTNNGLIDIVASSWGLSDQLRYFENSGDGKFVDRTEEAGLTGITGGLNLIHADFNNSGYKDVFVLRGAWLGQAGHHPNSLLRNNGDGTFTDVTKSAGLLSFHPTQTAVWADFNNNGWLDLFIGNESTPDDPHPSELYLNNKDGTFRNVSLQAGVTVNQYVKGAVAGDLNNNGYSDLYLSVLDGNNILLENRGINSQGVPLFMNTADRAGVTEPYTSFPVWLWDFNNNGWLDIFVSGYYANGADVANEYLGRSTEAVLPKLYKNNGDGTFTDVTEPAGLDKVMYAMGSNFGDLNNSGYLDFYVGTGDPDMRALMPNRMFMNVNGEHFEEVTAAGGFGHLQKGHGVSFADINNNGHQDIFTVIGGAFEGDIYMNALFENPGNDHNWIILKFEGEKSNRAGLGNRVKLVLEDAGSNRTIHRTVTTGGSFGSSAIQLEIGLGTATRIDELEVFWPASEIRQTFTGLDINQVYKITEFSEEPEAIQRQSFEFSREAEDHHVQH
ncbi:MAG: CRTAC1 family protein [Balneolaceae bacterium]|nr:CRTAC1 family protein [Balneolaceae bacterium]